MSDTVAILIPTHNSTHSLDIILSGLIKRFDGSSIHVVDSSDQRNEAWANRGLHYRHFPSHSISRKLTIALRDIVDEYVVLHPDDDFFNYEVIPQIREGMRGEGFSSALALTLLLTLGRDAPQVSPWRLTWFEAMLQNVRSGPIPWHRVNSPSYPVIWGIHKRRYLLEFFELSQQIDWLSDCGAHVVLYGRLFNMFMAAKGPFFVCDKPTFIRMSPLGKWKYTLRLEEWLDLYRSGTKEQRRFISELARIYGPSFRLPQLELEQMIVESLSIDNTAMRELRARLGLRKKFFDAIALRPQIIRVPAMEGAGHINVKHSRHEISARRFRKLLTEQIEPFLVSQGSNLVTYWRASATQQSDKIPSSKTDQITTLDSKEKIKSKTQYDGWMSCRSGNHNRTQ